MYFYYTNFGISLALIVLYAYIFHKHFDVNITILAVLVPIINFGFLIMGLAKSVDEALVGLKISYIGGCYLMLSAMMLIYGICGVKLKPWLKALLFFVSTGIYITCLTIGYSDIFYVGKPDIAFAYGAAYLTNKHYGPFHTVFYVLVSLYYVATIGVVIYSFFKRRQVPLQILIMITIAVTISMLGFFGGRLITNEIELLPVTYNVGMIIYLIIASRLRLYDPSDSVLDALVQEGETGFISFDNKMRYLGSNETAKKMIPELNDLIVDRRVDGNPWLKQHIIPLIEEYERDSSHDKSYLERDDKTYFINLNRLTIGRRNRGYQFYIDDDTSNQQYIKLIKQYNIQLEDEVAKKTKNVVEMQEKLVLGMATMIEGRDNSTGGHIKRTSDCIRILVEEIKKSGKLKLSDEFCFNLIKAAPMHDLGKIAVDDAILRKPGRFTPEEFEIMKTHAAEGARIIKQILKGTDDKAFMEMAINVAHYHHERWDGSGYPNKLKGEEIPLEARIMAIADVYDALVSKRVYKESLSFEMANQIILEGMGSQFDPQLKEIYEASRERLEQYYQSQTN